MGRVQAPGLQRVVVIGAGIVGVCSAIHLRRRGHDVILVDRQGPGEAASGGNGGVLASCSVAPVTVPGLRRRAIRMVLDREGPLFLRWSYLPRLAPWVVRYLAHCRERETRRISEGIAALVTGSLEEHEALTAGTAARRWLRASDYVFAYGSRAEFEAERFVWDLRRDAGFRWIELEGEALAERELALSHDYRFAAVVPGHGIVSDPARYVKDLARHFVEIGGRILRDEVLDFTLGGARLEGLRTGTGTLPADTAVIAAGAWSKRLTDRLGVPVPLESERGYHIEFERPSGTLRCPTMLAKAKFVATPMDGRIRCAGLVEFGGLKAGPSEAPFRLLERKAREAFPELRFEGIRRWMGHRPATTDSLPVIGPSRRSPDIHFAFGHHHIGLTAGPRTGRLVADLVTGQKPNIDLAPYRADRFSRNLS